MKKVDKMDQSEKTNLIDSLHAKNYPEDRIKKLVEVMDDRVEQTTIFKGKTIKIISTKSFGDP